MDKDFSRFNHYYDARFNTKTDRKRDAGLASRPRVKQTGDGPEQTYIRYDPALGRYVNTPGKLPTKRKSGAGAKDKAGKNRTRRRAERLAERDDGWKCYWCNIPLSYELEGGDTNYNRTRPDARYPTIDHVIELANGGPDTDENCVLSCQPCNSARNKTFHERRPDVL